MKETDYLSDDDLLGLIEDIECQGMETAPGGLRENIFMALGIKEEDPSPGVCQKADSRTEEPAVKPPNLLTLRRQYRKFCLEVGFAAAACAAFLLIATGNINIPAAGPHQNKAVFASAIEKNHLSELGDRNTVMEMIGDSRVITDRLDEITIEPEQGEKTK